jgi:hypothetical protein
MVDFAKKLTIDAKGTTRRYDINGSTELILEDVLGRADRQHPFWAKVQAPLK